MLKVEGLLLAAIAVVTVIGVLRAGPAPPTVQVKALEFAYQPKEMAVRAGDMVFVIENVGAIEHNFLLEDSTKKSVGKIAVIAPGTSEQLRVTLRPGAYEILCDLPGHRDAGMTATVRVRE